MIMIVIFLELLQNLQSCKLINSKNYEHRTSIN